MRFLLALLLVLPVIAHAADDIVFADFEGADYGEWVVAGEAFGSAPAQGTLPHQMQVTGFLGHGLVNSFYGGDKATGTLTSPPFIISRRYISFLIGGGGFDGKTCMNLLVDGKAVRTATGPNTKPGGSEALGPAAWDVSALVGKKATIQIVDDATGGWGHINVDQIVFTDTKPATIARLLADPSREFVAEHKYLWIPIKSGGPQRRMEILVDGQVVHYSSAELADAEADWWSPLDLSEWKGHKVAIRVDKLPETSSALTSMHQTDEWKHAEQLYREPLRPQFHFSARRGWLNDPNGLVFYNAEYHLFFQHSPFSFRGGPKMWGHAVSRDLVHWTEIDGEALWADELGQMYSGSAVVDRENTSGFGSKGNPPLVLIYTAAGRPFTQCIAYSTDGRKFIKYEKNPVVANVSNGNRDPKVIWHAPTKRWVMTFYAGLQTEAGKDEKGKTADHHTVQFYTSPNLREWTKASVTDGGTGDDRFLYECPDFFPLAVDNKPADTKWLLTAADAEYALGSFDGTRFTMETQKIGPRSRAYYAAQTFSDEPTGRRIQIPWLQPATPGMPFNQCMGVPVELSLRTTAVGPRLYRWPVKELDQLHGAAHIPHSGKLKEDEDTLAKIKAPELFDLQFAISPGSATQINLAIDGMQINYDVAKQELTENKHVHAAPLVDGELRLRVLHDRAITEMFAADGLTYAAMPLISKADQRGLSLTVTGGDAKILSLTLHEMESAW